jgi:predicted dehydrogenase
MIAKEKARPANERLDFVAIVTPNHEHVPPARAALLAGFPVMCDKPLAVSLAEARELSALVRKTRLLFGLTHNYAGYPMVKEARHRVAAGELGRIRRVVAEYPQGWLSSPLEATGQKQAAWRTDPAKSGAGGCIGDIGTHIYHLISFVTGLEAEAICADLSTFVGQRKLDDNAHLMLRFKGGAKGMIWASQVAVGCENGLQLRVFGDKGGIVWRQENPNELIFSPLREAPRRITRGGHAAGDAAARLTRVPSGHPEGYIEGFANIYTEIAAAIFAAREGKPVDERVVYPAGADGEKGVAFIEAAVRSSAAGATWVKIPAAIGEGLR